MAGTYQLQIQTIYSADDVVASEPSSLRLRALALLTLATAAAWLYVTWGPVATNILNEATMAGAMLQAGGALPLLAPEPTAGAQTDEPPTTARTPEERQQAAADDRHKTQQAQITLVGLASIWIGGNTLVGLWLAMAGAAGLRAGRWAKILGMFLAPLALLAVTGIVGYVEHEYHWLESLMPSWVLPGLIAIGVVFGASLGALFQRRGAGLLRLGGILVVLSGLFSVTVIWSAQRWGNLPTDPMAGVSYLKIFAVQSAYGWFLLLGMIGLR